MNVDCVTVGNSGGSNDARVTGNSQAIIDFLVRSNSTVATAESLTGGLVVAQLIAIPGASDAVRGGLVVYASDLKCSLAGVNPSTIRTCGPVSLQTARELASGARESCGASWGLSTTGVAGPGAADGCPAGTVVVAIADPSGHIETHEFMLTGDRDSVRQQTTGKLLELFLERLDAAMANEKRDDGDIGNVSAAPYVKDSDA